MRIRRVRLVNLRCHQHLDVEFGSGLNLVVGGNGTGKTSLVEAICLALQGTSPRTHRPTECILSGAEHLRVEVELGPDPCVGPEAISGGAASNYRTLVAAAAFSRSGERRLQADGSVLSSVERWESLVPVRTFFPDDLRLVKGSPRRRREFLDALIARVSSEYAASLARYGKALGQRNALLQRHQLGDEHGPWETILAEEGLVVTRARARELSRFAPIAGSIYQDLMNNTAVGLRMIYRTNVGDMTMAEYQEALRDQREGDGRRTFTHTGPHRDDVRLVAGGIDLRGSGSQGEQRGALLALVLASAQWAAAAGLSLPILLLDDVMSELDHARRRSLVRRLLSEGQSIITTTDLHHFENDEIKTAHVIEIP